MCQQEKLAYREAEPCFYAWTALKYRLVVARLPVPPSPTVWQRATIILLTSTTLVCGQANGTPSETTREQRRLSCHQSNNSNPRPQRSKRKRVLKGIP